MYTGADVLFFFICSQKTMLSSDVPDEPKLLITYIEHRQKILLYSSLARVCIRSHSKGLLVRVRHRLATDQCFFFSRKKSLSCMLIRRTRQAGNTLFTFAVSPSHPNLKGPEVACSCPATLRRMTPPKSAYDHELGVKTCLPSLLHPEHHMWIRHREGN